MSRQFRVVVAGLAALKYFTFGRTALAGERPEEVSVTCLQYCSLSVQPGPTSEMGRPGLRTLPAT